MLRTTRERAGLSQRQLARRAGTSQAAVSCYERGTVSPSVRTLARLLAACREGT
ncbi:MAG: helix-turn-helix transcriptional regulator, partial [Candidatus Dormibacteraeota bacterium]|nr:helix-turn-helix transcriptional regulator [Candidatus Dormibacteraeota bacterium]